MSLRLLNRFVKERIAGRKLFVPFITAGDRGLSFTRRALLALAEAGADAVELGVPFSDPLADGKAIQASSQRALARKTSLNSIFTLVQQLRQETEIPILLMGYLNPFLQKGPSATAAAAVLSGVDGLIIPDLPPEAAREWIQAMRPRNLDLVFLTTPNSTWPRLQAVARASTGYIYYVSVTGTTGVRDHLPADLHHGISRVRTVSSLPILVGFGISQPQQAAKAAAMADGVIVGSVLVQMMSKAESDQSVLRQLSRLAGQIAAAVKKG